MLINLFLNAVKSFFLVMLMSGYLASFAQAQTQTNIARGKPAMQTSTQPGGEASRAVDGNRDPDYTKGGASHTASISHDQYWQVDLQGTFAISEIKIFNTTNDMKFGESLQIWAGNTLVWTAPIPFHSAAATKEIGLVATFAVPPNIAGTHVRVTNRANWALSIAEVEVAGVQLQMTLAQAEAQAKAQELARVLEERKTNIARGKPAMQTTTGWGGEASRAVDGNKDGMYTRNSVTSTGGIDAAQYWQVNLEGKFVINGVNIWQSGIDSPTKGKEVQVWDGDKMVWSAPIPDIAERVTITVPGIATGPYLDPYKGDVNRFAIPGIVGTHVRVTNRPNWVLNIAEVEVAGVPVAAVPVAPPVNIARGKPTMQTTTFADGRVDAAVAARAVDGNRDNKPYSAFASRTAMWGYGQYWMVDLQGSFAITEIKIFNTVGDSPPTSGESLEIWAGNTMVWTAPVPSGAGGAVAVPSVVGTHVRVTAPSRAVLSIAELEVAGQQLQMTLEQTQAQAQEKKLMQMMQERKTNIARGKPAFQTTTFGAGLGAKSADRAVDGNKDPRVERSSQSETIAKSPDQYWMVDLQGVFAISEIKIFNSANNSANNPTFGEAVQIWAGNKLVWQAPIPAIGQVGTFINPGEATPYPVTFTSITVPPNIAGTHVRITNRPNSILILAEVEVAGVQLQITQAQAEALAQEQELVRVLEARKTNIARAKPTMWSTGSKGVDAFRAVDGNRDGLNTPNRGSVTSGGGGVEAYWSVALQGKFAINGIAVFNDSGRAAADGYAKGVEIWDGSKMVWSAIAPLLPEKVVLTVPAVAGPYPGTAFRFTVPNIVGTQVRVTNNRSGSYLYFAEVEVSGVQVPDTCSAPAGPKVNWSGCDKANINISGAQLFESNLSGANLSGTNLYQVNLVNAFAEGANFARSNISGGAGLTGGNFKGANFEGANLLGSGLAGTNLMGANFANANLSKVDLKGANLTGAILTNADLTDAQINYPQTGIIGIPKSLPLGWKLVNGALSPK